MLRCPSCAPEAMTDLGILTVRIRWRLSGNTETKQIHYMCTVKVMKQILEREIDETAQQKTRVRLFLGSQELYHGLTIAAMNPDENFELAVMVL